jgi:hypothetical protein
VDAYYADLRLVVEYWETQHLLDTPIMDNKPTCSDCTRGVQRRIYDERRSTVLHDNGIRLVVIRYDQLEHYSCGRLRRDSETDEARLRELLRDFPPE